MLPRPPLPLLTPDRSLGAHFAPPLRRNHSKSMVGPRPGHTPHRRPEDRYHIQTSEGSTCPRSLPVPSARLSASPRSAPSQIGPPRTIPGPRIHDPTFAGCRTAKVRPRNPKHSGDERIP
eukprot:scaffold283_cov316-Pavlova_lutheri.AAC.36